MDPPDDDETLDVSPRFSYGGNSRNAPAPRAAFDGTASLPARLYQDDPPTRFRVPQVDGSASTRRYVNRQNNKDMRMRLEDICQRWENFAMSVTRAVAVGQALPSPPAITPDMPPALQRISEAALSALAALWTAEAEARYMRRQVTDIQASSDVAGSLFKEREKHLELRKRDLAMSERVSTCKSEINGLKERKAEFGMARVECKAESQEIRQKGQSVQDANRERDYQLQQLKRRIDDLMVRLEARMREQDSMRVALQEVELRGHRLRRELYESESERKRMLEVVSKVLKKYDQSQAETVMWRRPQDRFGNSSSSMQQRAPSPTRKGTPSPPVTSRQ